MPKNPHSTSAALGRQDKAPFIGNPVLPTIPIIPHEAIKHCAKLFMTHFEAYKEVGFSEQQAFELTLHITRGTK